MHGEPFPKISWKKTEHRLLAIEVRSRRLGYAIFGGKNTLMDWGISTFANIRDYPSLDQRVLALSRSFRPKIVVLSQRGSDREFKPFLYQCRLRFVLVAKVIVKTHFAQIGHSSKQDTARFIAGLFPELAWQLPRRRKPWEGEPWNQILFDAVALGIFYFDSDN